MKEVYQVMSGMLGQEQRIAQIANNLANVNTVGFKKQGMEFQDFLKLAAEAGGAGETATWSAELAQGALAENNAPPVWPIPGAAYTDYTAGPLQLTGQPLDMAIDGEGFFQVEMEGGGKYYTRAGNFMLNAEGGVITAEGHAVLDDGGRAISLDPKGGAIQVSADGTIRQGATVGGRIGIVTFPDPQRLERHGKGLWRAPEGVESEAVETPRVRAGILEGSNVNPIREMTDMIEVQRAYEMNQKTIQAIDDITRKRIEAMMQ